MFVVPHTATPANYISRNRYFMRSPPTVLGYLGYFDAFPYQLAYTGHNGVLRASIARETLSRKTIGTAG